MEATGFLTFILFSILNSIQSENSFNYEIGSRVNGYITEFLNDKVTASMSPLVMIYGNVMNVTEFLVDTPRSGHSLFFTLKKQYLQQISTVQICFHNKLHFKYEDVANAPNGFIMSYSSKSNFTVQNIYSVLKNGLQFSRRVDDIFDCTASPMYIQSESERFSSWSAPFLQPKNNQPVVSLVAPLQNISFAGKFKFIGAIASNVELAAISSYLSSAYKGTDRDVFIIEKSTGYLIGSSLDVLMYSVTNNVYNLMKATQSENDIISGATAILNEKGWPDYLVIYNGYYLQSVSYTDSIPGIEWMIVVLLPAVLEPDHLGPESSLFNVGLGLGVLAIIISSVSLVLTLYFWKSRMMQLSQPIFTVIVLVGCILLGVSCITFLGENNANNCSSRAYLFNIAISIAYAPLLVKCYRIYCVFVLAWRADMLVHGGSHKLIQPVTLIIYVSISLSIDIFIILFTVYMGGYGTQPRDTFTLSINGAYDTFTYCGYHNNSSFFYSELVYDGLLVLLGCYLAYQIRLVSDAIAGTKALLAIMYNTAIIGSIVIALNRTVKDIRIRIVYEIAGITFSVIVASFFLVVPVIYTIVFKGDKEAAVEVIDEMYETRQHMNAAKGESRQNSHEVLLVSNHGESSRGLKISPSVTALHQASSTGLLPVGRRSSQFTNISSHGNTPVASTLRGSIGGQSLNTSSHGGGPVVGNTTSIAAKSAKLGFVNVMEVKPKEKTTK